MVTKHTKSSKEGGGLMSSTIGLKRDRFCWVVWNFTFSHCLSAIGGPAYWYYFRHELVYPWTR